MNQEITVLRHNTGCQLRLKSAIREILSDQWEAMFGPQVVNKTIVIAHRARPNFATVDVFLGVSLDPSRKFGPQTKHYQNSFCMTLDEIRQDLPVLESVLKEKIKQCLDDLKAEIKP